MADDAPIARALKGMVQSTDDINEGMRYVHQELALGRPAVWLGKGPEGVALIVGHVKVSRGPSGSVVLGFPITPVAALQLIERLQAVLAQSTAAALPFSEKTLPNW